MKRKLLITLLAVVSCLACALGLAACDGDGGGNTQHSHSWSQSWERNDTHHWHNCTAENCPVTDNSQKDGYAEHDFSDGDCVCGQPKPTDGLEYMSNGDGKSYSVTGIGTCTDTVIVIPSVYNNLPVTKIAENAFMNEYKIYSVIIPDSVTTIGSSAFQNCSALTTITIPDSVTSIGNYTFIRSRKKTKVTITEGVTTNGRNTFIRCRALTTITIPDNVTTIGSNAFEGCDSLKYNEYENAYYFGNASSPYLVLIKAKDTSITNCTINSNTKIIYSFAFYDCSRFTSITIPDSVTSIGSSAFNGCYNLTSVTIPDSVTSIGSYAFASCRDLPTITKTDSVTSIGD